MAGGRLLALGVGDKSFGLPSGIVREVARMPHLARVPQAPPALMGLANIRGAVVPVLSLASLVERPSRGERRVVIVDQGEPIGLAVDQVSRLIEADEAALDALDIAALVARAVPRSAARRSAGSGVTAAETDAEAGAETVPLVVFAIGDQEFALPIGAVEQVLRLPDRIARMPRADAAVVGSAALDGELLPLLSLRALLALPDSEGTRGRVLVARIGAHRVGLVVDAVRAILHVAEDDIDPVPQVLARGGAEARIQAICRLEGGNRLVSVLAADQLLRDDITARLFQAAERHDREETAPEARVGEQFLLFGIGDDEFGLPIGAVEEVAMLPAKLARLPRAPAFVHGVMNLRGRVIPVIDQAHRFGVKAAAGRKRRVVVVRIGDVSAGFVVDAVSDVLRIEADALRPAPDLGNAETRVFDRVASLPEEQRIVLIVSPRELLDRAEQDLLRGISAKGAMSTP